MDQVLWIKFIMPSKKKKDSTVVQQSRQSAESRIDKLLELVDAVARVDTKMDSFCKDTIEELKELKGDLAGGVAEHVKITARVEQLEKDLIAARNERTEWKAEFEKWKWRLGVIAPILTVLITTAIIALLEHFLGSFW